jgi:hypothetical protein
MGVFAFRRWYELLVALILAGEHGGPHRLAPIKHRVRCADVDSVHKFSFSSELEDGPELRPMRRRRRSAIALAAFVLAVRVGFIVLDDRGSIFHPSPYPSCGSPSFEPPESREGICVVYEHSGIVVKNIVDRNSILRMPEYTARVLTWATTGTHVTNWLDEHGRFPDGRGMLVSFEVEIGNPGDEPLQYGPLITRSPVPSYRSNPPAELALPLSAGNPGEDQNVVAILNPRGAPSPSLFGQPPVLPHSSITGWISFVMSPSESELVGLPRSDLKLAPVDENPSYIGVIRLGTGDRGPERRDIS